MKKQISETEKKEESRGSGERLPRLLFYRMSILLFFISITARHHGKGASRITADSFFLLLLLPGTARVTA